ncbi:hypothetical protein [Taklimakanibacter deserti]|uniref:hypothetical protein n=1 Tax=Taklimakanibacter deserti TaxID=2267839 RepID=UPI000E647AD6
MCLAELAAYGIDEVTGFVPRGEPLRRLPPIFDAWEDIVPDISGLIRTRGLRSRLEAFPLLDTSGLADEPSRERAMLILTVFANGWVWGGSEPHLRIPAPIAVPLCALAERLDRPPLVHYASMLLRNWRKLDPVQPVSADNARMQIQFLGGVDEDWFFMASLGVELAGAPLLRIIHQTIGATQSRSDAELAADLEQVAAGMEPVLAALARMRAWCDPHVFFHRVRPYLAGWPALGAVYEGVSESPRVHVGGSAGQSSLIQVLDAALGIDHGTSRAGIYLRDMRRYMPVGHRRFIADVERLSEMRARARAGSPALKAAYNEAVEQVDTFRRRHIGLAHDYILKPSGLAADEKGTGGTDFVDFLRDARNETARSKI